MSVKEQQVYNEIAILESEIEADEAEAMAREYGNKEVERRLEERNVKNENQEYLDNNKENELLKEMQEKLEKANKVAADYINANNILKSENSHLKMVEEDLEDKNQDLEKRKILNDIS